MTSLQNVKKHCKCCVSNSLDGWIRLSDPRPFPSRGGSLPTRSIPGSVEIFLVFTTYRPPAEPGWAVTNGYRR
jgi:hypothetical protein